jgi:predicted DNA-binding transcriptional regulator AlpA
MPALLKETEAASLLGVEPATLTRWRYIRTGPKYKKIGSLVRYSRSDLEAYIASVTVTP